MVHPGQIILLFEQWSCFGVVGPGGKTAICAQTVTWRWLEQMSREWPNNQTQNYVLTYINWFLLVCLMNYIDGYDRLLGLFEHWGYFSRSSALCSCKVWSGAHWFVESCTYVRPWAMHKTDHTTHLIEQQPNQIYAGDLRMTHHDSEWIMMIQNGRAFMMTFQNNENAEYHQHSFQ